MADVAVSETQRLIILDDFSPSSECPDGAMYFVLDDDRTISATFLAATSYSPAHGVLQLCCENDRIRLAEFYGPDAFLKTIEIAERVATALGVTVVPHQQIELLMEKFFAPSVAREAC